MNSDVRPFPVSSLRASVERQIAALPPGTNGVVVAYRREDGADRFAVMARVGEHFTFAGNLEHRPNRPLSADVSVAWTF